MLTYVVLVYEKYFEDLMEPIYKLEKSTMKPNKRNLLNKIVFSETCDCIQNIEAMMRNKYIHRLDVGNNYFYGNVEDMKQDVMNVIEEEVYKALLN